MKCVEQCMSDAGLTPKDIDHVVLVGGQTRTPMVQSAVTEFFAKRPHRGVNPDEVVAVGAAIQGNMLVADDRDLLLLDVTPLSLGIATFDGHFATLIARNTTAPVQKAHVFTTTRDKQTAVKIRVLQGESEKAADNHLLGEFVLSSIPPAPKGDPEIEVSFDIDANGIVNVSARDSATNAEQSITVSAPALRPGDREIMQDHAEHRLEEVTGVGGGQGARAGVSAAATQLPLGDAQGRRATRTTRRSSCTRWRLPLDPGRIEGLEGYVDLCAAAGENIARSRRRRRAPKLVPAGAITRFNHRPSRVRSVAIDGRIWAG
jgi:hypothetical protein